MLLQLFRKTLAQIDEQAELLPDGTLLVGGQAIAVIYFRAGYAPTDYPSESHKDVTKKPAEETPEITPTVDEAVLSPVNQDTITPLPSESDTMEPKEMLLSDEEKERNSAEEEKLEESPIDEEAAHNSPVVPAISIAVRQFGHFLRELSHSTQSAAAVAASIAEVDSIPAVFGVTRDPFVVFSSNFFAILGLRSLYTLISEGMADLEYLQVRNGPAMPEFMKLAA